MFAQIKQIFNPQNKDLRKRILFTLGVLLLFKVGTTIPIPGVPKIDPKTFDFLGLINAINGGAIEQRSIFALGVMPYITASIIIQLLQMDIIPPLAELSKQGQEGRNKLNTITRITGIVLAFIQGYMLSFAYISKDTMGGTVDPLMYLQFAVIVTAGTAFLLWLGDQITAKGIGNGISLIIMAGIIATIPSMFSNAFNTFVNMNADTQALLFGIVKFIGFVILYLGIIVGIIYVETAERRIPIQYANSSTKNMGKQNYIPFKLNSAGVIPVIFASALMTIPTILKSFIKGDFEVFVSKWLTLNTGTGLLLYIIFIFVFGYFYTFFQLKPKELAENLQQNGGYIPGVRPGEETIKYVTKILKRITIVGTTFLAILAALPIVCSFVSGLGQNVSIGGTGILIVVGVTLETYKQLQSNLVTRKYTRGRR